MKQLTERYANQIAGQISCLDRVVINGTIPEICHAEAITGYLYRNGVRIFDYPRWASELRDQIRQNAELVAKQCDLAIEFLRSAHVRKESLVKQILDKRGGHEGMVCIFSAMEPCASFTPWHDKKTGKTFVKPDSGKCLHYYFYFIDKQLGLCHLRVPTWAPFRLQFYFNGHGRLAAELEKAGIANRTLDNAFVQIDHWDKAQQLADGLNVKALHHKFNGYARRLCPPVGLFASGYHWSLMQVEYAMDIVFKRQQDLAPVYENLVRTAVHAVKAEDVAMFFGRKLHGAFQDELGNNFQTRIQGTRVKHHMGKAAIKMYDKFGLILRIETTLNDVSFFKHHRRVEHRDGSWQMKTAPVKKTIYSLPDLLPLMYAANRRYLEFISSLDDPTPGLRDLEKISEPVIQGERSLRGFNLFCSQDLALFESLLCGQFNLSGLQNRHLRQILGKKGSQISLVLKRLRSHGLIKKIGHCYKYYLTALGRRVVATAVRLRQTTIIPSLCTSQV
jgi:hypothetical protein